LLDLWNSITSLCFFFLVFFFFLGDAAAAVEALEWIDNDLVAVLL